MNNADGVAGFKAETRSGRWYDKWHGGSSKAEGGCWLGTMVVTTRMAVSRHSGAQIVLFEIVDDCRRLSSIVD